MKLCQDPLAMAEIGRFNSLIVLRSTPQGLYLDGGEHGDILLPKRYVTADLEEGTAMAVFVMRDSEDRLVATTETPIAMVGDVSALKVVSVHPTVGAFLDWGLAKDLLLPFREQSGRVREGDWVVVKICLDPKSDRIIASTRWNRVLDAGTHNFRRGQAVSIMMVDASPLGWNVLIHQKHLGLLYADEVPADVRPGTRLKGYIKQVRSDGKLDITLKPDRGARVVSLRNRILMALEEQDGFLALNDQSPPEAIRAAFGISKKVFKQTLGSLYKERVIRMENDGIHLVRD